jgi:hypothetical protein
MAPDAPSTSARYPSGRLFIDVHHEARPPVGRGPSGREWAWTSWHAELVGAQAYTVHDNYIRTKPYRGPTGRSGRYPSVERRCPTLDGPAEQSPPLTGDPAAVGWREQQVPESGTLALCELPSTLGPCRWRSPWPA